MKRILSIFAMAFGVSSAAQAGIYLEPYLGYETGAVKQTDLTPTLTTVKTSGNTIGLRLGYKFLLPWVALDYSTLSGKAKPDGGTESDFTQNTLGVVVGADVPIVKPFVGYGFSNEATVKSDAGDVKYKGTYMKAGFGLGFIPFVNVNLEYRINNYDKITAGGVEFNKADIYQELKHDTVLISVSLPLNL